ncbi:hypothetical protein pb186bvf_003459 [Paramecium bursaria]
MSLFALVKILFIQIIKIKIKNMIIGQNVADACVNEFNALKLQKSHRFVIYKIQNNDIVVDVIGARESTYAEFLTHLPNNEARYAIYDFQAQTNDVPPMKVEKIVFIFWSPDTQAVKEKMIYSSAKEALKKKLPGIAKELQANDPSEVDEKELVKLVLH